MVTCSWRLVPDGPAPGDWNMAVDDLLLEEASAVGVAALRTYAWSQPTLSLGYFQALEEIPAVDRERYAVVRRPTGGGAILHDREVTYSVAVPQESLDGAELYARTNRAIVAALAELGIAATERGDATAPRAQRGPFLCFARCGATDIIAPSSGGLKLAGSAQRRRAGGILQHGSVLLASDAPGSIGVEDVLGRPIGFYRLAMSLARCVEREFADRMELRPLDREERDRAEAIRLRRYGSAIWLVRGNRKTRHGPSADLVRSA